MNQQVGEAVRRGCIALTGLPLMGAGYPRLKPWAIAVSSLTGRRGWPAPDHLSSLSACLSACLCTCPPETLRARFAQRGLRATRQGRYNNSPRLQPWGIVKPKPSPGKGDTKLRPEVDLVVLNFMSLQKGCQLSLERLGRRCVVEKTT